MSQYRFVEWMLQKQLEAVENFMKTKDMIWDEESKSFVRIEDSKDEQ